MAIKINEIFRSIQGEGRFAGTPAVFVRFSGCDRKCTFCDTNHLPFREMEVQDIVDEVENFGLYRKEIVVITGGEPTVQYMGLLALAERLQKEQLRVHVETNGYMKLTKTQTKLFDWITYSPKDKLCYDKMMSANEVKILYPQFADMINSDEAQQAIGNFVLAGGSFFIQPVEINGNYLHLDQCINFVKGHPWTRLSIQIHKFLNIQ